LNFSKPWTHKEVIVVEVIVVEVIVVELLV
jgi:hypothetical protein